MGLLAKLDRQIHNATYQDREGWFADWVRGGAETDSGVTISERTAMQIATVWKCVSWRAKMFGMLPKKIFERVEMRGRLAQRPAPRHDLYSLIHAAPNPAITAAAWSALISADVHLWGNSYAWIERPYRNSPRIRALWRIVPDAVRLDQDYDKQETWYMVRGSNGVEEKFWPDEILHIRGLGYDGLRGYSPIQLHKQTLGWVKATHQFSSKFYKNAFRPSGLLIAPQAIKEPAKSQLLAALRESGKEGGLALIEGALEHKSLSIPQDDMQFLDTMQFQDEDICGIMEVKPHKVGIMRNMTNNNVEQQNIEAVTDTLQPFTVSVEQWFDLQLLSDRPSSGLGGGTERDRYFMQCELKALLRGDTAAQTAHLIAMRDRGVYDGNDCAEYLGNPPFEGGDVRVINAAYIPLDMIRDLAEKKATAPAPGAPNPSGGPPAETPETQTALAKGLFAGIFRDAIGRVINRQAKDRPRVAAAILEAGVTALAQFCEKDSSEFIVDYIGGMVQRSQVWKEASVESIVTEELDRAISAFRRHHEH